METKSTKLIRKSNGYCTNGFYTRVLGFIASIDARTRTKKCTVDINTDLGIPQPLYFQHKTTDFVEIEDGTSTIQLDANEKIDIFCEDGFRSPFSNETQFLTATCISGNRFTIDKTSRSLLNVTCVGKHVGTTRLTEHETDFGNTVEVGYDVDGTWIPLMEICHDNETASTLWVKHRLTPKSEYFQRGVDRRNFMRGNFYKGLSVDTLYSKNEQRSTVAKILGSKKLADQIISDDSDLYLARGHLAAKTDYIFGAHQLITFFFINVAPQWQVFNNGNWLHVETGVKKYVLKRNIDVDVYTGTHGIFTYPDVDDEEQEIYLAWDKKRGAHQIPVPRFYYKVVIADEIKAGIVFIGVNNPYATPKSIKSDYILCPDVSDQIKYINWDRTNITLGYSYACSVSEFTKVVKDLPKLPKVTKLLL